MEPVLLASESGVRIKVCLSAALKKAFGSFQMTLMRFHPEMSKFTNVATIWGSKLESEPELSIESISAGLPQIWSVLLKLFIQVYYPCIVASSDSFFFTLHM